MPLSVYLCFGMGTMLANFHMCGIMLLLGEVLSKLTSYGPSNSMLWICSSAFVQAQETLPSANIICGLACHSRFTIMHSSGCHYTHNN